MVSLNEGPRKYRARRVPSNEARTCALQTARGFSSSLGDERHDSPSAGVRGNIERRPAISADDVWIGAMIHEEPNEPGAMCFIELVGAVDVADARPGGPVERRHERHLPLIAKAIH